MPKRKPRPRRKNRPTPPKTLAAPGPEGISRPQARPPEIPCEGMRSEWNTSATYHHIHSAHYWHLDPSVPHAALRRRHSRDGTH